MAKKKTLTMPPPPLMPTEEVCRYILDTIPQIVWTATPEGDQDFANLRWYEFNGITFGEPDPEPWRSIVHPEDVELTARTWANSLATGEPYSCLHRNRRHDGEYRWVLSRAVAQRDGSGRIVRWIGSGTDITEQKVAEAELIKYRDHLEELVRERTAELEVAKERAEEASRAKTQFLASMSHELRTPLNAILGYAHILKRAANLTEDQQQQVEIMRTSGEHLLKLINDVLDVGRIEAHRMELEVHPLELPPLLEMVYHVTKLKAEEKSLGLTFEPGRHLPQYVLGDERKLKQVLLNLLGNAIKYTEAGAVTFGASYGQTGPGTFRCEIIDTGTGIPKEKLEAIFDPFTQLAPPAEREGTGLGLTITRELVHLMGGKLGVESIPGEGSTFWLEVALPIAAKPDLVQMAPKETVTGYRGARKRILVVDDVAANTSFLLSLLGPLGFTVSTAGDGKEAVRRAIEVRPELILIDLVMPEMDGLAAVREMKKHPELKGTRIIGTSATVTDGSYKQPFAALCDDFVEKPIRIEQLLEKVGRLLGIEWETTQAPFEPQPELESEQLRLPSLSALEELHELALRGDLRRVAAWSMQLEEKEPECAVFADKVRTLAGGFRIQAILRLVQAHLPDRK